LTDNAILIQQLPHSNHTIAPSFEKAFDIEECFPESEEKMRRIPSILLAIFVGLMPIFSMKNSLIPSVMRSSVTLSATPTPAGQSTSNDQNLHDQTISNVNTGKTIYLPLAINGNQSQAAPTPTPIPQITKTPLPGNLNPGLKKYYLADRVIDNSDFAILANWGINTAIVDFDVNGSSKDWKAVFTEAGKYGIGIVIWPSDWAHPRPNCNWEAPFPVSANGDITKIKPLLDVASTFPNFIGVVNGHESFWTCTNMTFDEMAGLKTQLKAYALSKGRDIKVWNYINSLYSTTGSPSLPDNQISRIMDVAVTWLHCAGNAEGPCDTGKNSALAQINSDRARITKAGLTNQVDLVYIMQTFTDTSGSYTSDYSKKFTLSQLETYSCEFVKTQALDGFGYYTWDAGWWPDLRQWTDLQPAIPYVAFSASCR
jgi:hypothetical protein